MSNRLKAPTRPDHYNVRITSRASDGTLIVIDLSDVPKALWVKHLGVKVLSTIGSHVVGEAFGGGAIGPDDEKAEEGEN
jgi:hypothetical protein